MGRHPDDRRFPVRRFAGSDFQRILEPEDPVRPLPDMLAKQAFAPGRQMRRIRFDFDSAVAVDQRREPGLGYRVGCLLRSQIAAPLFRRADITQYELLQVGCELALVAPFHRRNNDAFLVQFVREWKRSGTHAPHIGVVSPAGGKENEAAGYEYRGNHGDVRQVRAACIGVVQNDRVAGAPGIDGVQRGFEAARHSAEMHGNVCRLSHHPAAAVEHGARKVQPLLDIGRIGRTLQGNAHFLSDP